MSHTARITEEGQITIPKELRDALGIGPGSRVAITRRGGTLVIRRSGTEPRGRQLVERLRGRGDVTLSTDEIMALMRGRR